MAVGSGGDSIRGPVKTSLPVFARQVRQETAKVVWPTRKETVLTTVMVLFMVLFCSIFLFVTDQVIAIAVRWILGLGA